MKLIKRATAVLLCVLICALILPLKSRAAEIRVELGNQTFIGNETTTAIVSIRNNSSVAMTDITVKVLDVTYDYNGIINPGETSELPITSLEITPEMLGTDLEFYIRWKENGTERSEIQKVYIRNAYGNDSTPEPTLAPEELIIFTCNAENPRAEEGEIVKISYYVENGTNSKITDIVITDSAVSSDPIVSGKTIFPGVSASFEYDYKMTAENVDTNPILSYKIADEGETRSKRADSVTLECVKVNLDVNITKQEANEKGTEFLINIANNGNKPVSSIRVYMGQEATDDTKIVHSFDLGVGASREISYISNKKGMSEVCFIVTAHLATGEAYEFKSETYTVWEYLKGNVDMQLDAVVADKLDKDGYVKVDFTLKNVGDVDMTNIVLTEDKMGKIGMFSDLTSGGSEKLSLTLYLNEARDLMFTVTAVAPNLQPFEYSATVSAQVVSAGVNDTTVSAFNASAIDVGGAVSKVLKRILTVLAFASGIFGVALVVLAAFEFQQNLANRSRKKTEKS